MLHLDDPLPWHLLDLARPVPPVTLPAPAWLDLLPHDPAAAMLAFPREWETPTGPPGVASALEQLLREAALGSPFGARAVVTPEQRDHLGQLLRRVPGPPGPGARGWSWRTTRYYAGAGVVASAGERDDGMFDLRAGSRHRSALRPLRAAGFAWQRFDG